MSRAAAILKNTAANYAQQVVAVAVFMFLTPYAARLLGTEQFGLWSLMWSMVGVLGLVDMGVSSAVVKFIADARGRDNPDRVRQLSATFFWVQSALALIVLLIAAALLPLIDTLFDIPARFERIAMAVFGILSFRVASGMPFGLFAGLLAAHRKEAHASLTKAAGTLVYGGCVFLALRLQPTAVTLATCNILVHVAANAVIILLARRAVPEFSLHPRAFRRNLVREISTFSGAAFLVQISSLLYTRVDTFVVQRFLALAAVARYSVAMQTISRGALFCRQMNSALTPLVAEMKGADDQQSIRLVLRKGTKLNTALATPLMGGLIWLAGDLVRSWMGPEFAASVLPLRFLAIAAWIDAVCGISGNVLTMTGHQKRMARLTVVGQLANIVLTLLLVRRFGIGGVAFASLVAGSSIACVTLGFTVRTFRISVWHTYGPILASAFPLGLMIAAISGLRWIMCATGRSVPTLLHVAVLELVGCVVFFAAFYRFGCSKKERRYYREKLAAPLSRFGIKV
jgi:O-antigen/teichoic acid export membrane protein